MTGLVTPVGTTMTSRDCMPGVLSSITADVRNQNRLLLVQLPEGVAGIVPPPPHMPRTFFQDAAAAYVAQLKKSMGLQAGFRVGTWKDRPVSPRLRIMGLTQP